MLRPGAELLRSLLRPLLQAHAAEGHDGSDASEALLPQGVQVELRADLLCSGTDVLRPGAELLRSLLRPLLQTDAAEGHDGSDASEALLPQGVQVELRADMLCPGADVLRILNASRGPLIVDP